MKRKSLAIILAIAMVCSVFAGYAASAETFDGGVNVVSDSTDVPSVLSTDEATPEASIDPFEGQDGSESNPYKISNAETLVAFEDIVNSGNVYSCAVLTADIDMSGINFEPIGRYTDAWGYDANNIYRGTFDGNGYTISNLSVVLDTPHEAGLFGRTENAKIKNLSLVNATIVNSTKTRAGLLGGEMLSSIIENCFTDGTIDNGGSQTGGIAAEAAWNSSFINCATTYNKIAVGSGYQNCFFVSEADDSTDGTTNFTDANVFQSGEAVYKMNAAIGGDTPVWYQNIDNGSVDKFPVTSNAHGVVYEVDLIACGTLGTTIEVVGKTYSNSTDAKESKHVYVDGICSCGAVVTEEELIAARTVAIAELNAYVNLDDYREKERVDVQDAIIAAEAVIIVSNTFEQIDSALENGKTSIDDIKTDEELWREENAEYLTSKIAELQNYVDKSLYRTEQQTDIDNIIAEASSAINQSSSADEVEGKVVVAKTAIDAIETNYKLTLEENIAKWTAFYAQYAKEDLYTEENWILVQACNTEYSDNINNAKTIDEINSVYSKAVADISAIERNVTYVDGALLRRDWKGKGIGTVASIDAFLLDNSYINNEYNTISAYEKSTYLDEDTNAVFMISMSGYVSAPQTGEYLFRINRSDDAVRVDLNNEKAIWVDSVYDWINEVSPDADTVCKLSMIAGERVPINILISDLWANETARIQWKGPGIGDGETFTDIDRKYLSYSTENIKEEDAVTITNPISLNNITLSETENGTINGVNAIGYYADETANLTVVADEGYIFAGWVVDGVPVDGEVIEALTLTMNANHEVGALFEEYVEPTAGPTFDVTATPTEVTTPEPSSTDVPVVETTTEPEVYDYVYREIGQGPAWGVGSAINIGFKESDWLMFYANSDSVVEGEWEHITVTMKVPDDATTDLSAKLYVHNNSNSNWYIDNVSITEMGSDSPLVNYTFESDSAAITPWQGLENEVENNNTIAKLQYNCALVGVDKVTLEPGKIYTYSIDVRLEGAVEPTEAPTPKPTPAAALGFKGASLTLQENLNINYKVDVALFETVGYTNPYIKFVMGDEEKIITEYRVEGNRYIFDYENIVPHQMNETISATLCAKFNGETYTSAPVDYSVATYCYSMLSRYTSDAYAEFRTLLVDLLEYGAKSQEYMGYNTDNLVTANLTETQKSWGTSTDREFTSVMDTKYESIENPTVSWRDAGLNLQESVGMRFKIQASDIENMYVKVISDSGSEWIIPSEKFEVISGGYYVYFAELDAGQMSEPVCLTVYDGDVAVSNTVRYSIESYAATQQSSTNASLVALVRAMMKYGDAAKAYIN